MHFVNIAYASFALIGHFNAALLHAVAQGLL